MKHLKLFEEIDIKNHLQDRGIDLNNTRLLYDEESGDTFFFLYNLSGEMVGYQKYNPNYEKKGQRRSEDPKMVKYYIWVGEQDKGKKIAVWGLETYNFTDKYIFITEGIFDIIRVHEAGYPGIAVLCNDPSDQLKNWLKTLPQKKIVIHDNDKAGDKLKKIGDYCYSVRNGKDLNDLSQEEANEFLSNIISDIEGKSINESINDELYKEISLAEYNEYEHMKTSNFLLLNNYEKNLLKKYNILCGIRKYFIHGDYGETLISFLKNIDSWYIVSIPYIKKFYICDDIDGLSKLINDKLEPLKRLMRNNSKTFSINEKFGINKDLEEQAQNIYNEINSEENKNKNEFNFYLRSNGKDWPFKLSIKDKIDSVSGKGQAEFNYKISRDGYASSFEINLLNRNSFSLLIHEMKHFQRLILTKRATDYNTDISKAIKSGSKEEGQILTLLFYSLDIDEFEAKYHDFYIECKDFISSKIKGNENKKDIIKLVDEFLKNHLDTCFGIYKVDLSEIDLSNLISKETLLKFFNLMYNPSKEILKSDPLGYIYYKLKYFKDKLKLSGSKELDYKRLKRKLESKFQRNSKHIQKKFRKIYQLMVEEFITKSS